MLDHALLAVASVCLASLGFALWVTLRLFHQVDDALRLLASEGYREFARLQTVERPAKPKPLTQDEKRRIIADEEYLRAERDPYSQG